MTGFDESIVMHRRGGCCCEVGRVWVISGARRGLICWALIWRALISRALI